MIVAIYCISKRKYQCIKTAHYPRNKHNALRGVYLELRRTSKAAS